MITPEPTGHFGTILGWADEFRTLQVRTNADLPEDAASAREFGAEGIGLCRTEHMFLGDRLPIVQRMILADTPRRRTPRSRSCARSSETDFVGILEAMDGLPVTIRLLDPPLHEFLPDHEELIVQAGEGPSIADAETEAAAGRAPSSGDEVEPDARHPRVPARHPQARPLPHAGRGRSCRPRSSASRPAATRMSRS